MSKQVTVAATEQAPVTTGSNFTFDQLQRMAKSFVNSKLFGIKTEDEALSLLLISHAEGRHPALAARDFHIIQGRPSLKADTMLARFQAAGGKVDWKEYSETRCIGVFTHPQAGSVSIEWTIERAKQIGLAGKDNWKNYPRAMLRARCISEGVRTCFPGIAVGIYTPEEIESGEIDVTPTVTQAEAVREVVQSATALTPEEVEGYVNAMDVSTLAELQRVFEGAWKHATEAKDKAARERFKAAYDLMKSEISGRAPV